MRKIKFRAWDKVDKRFCTLREFEPCIIQEEGMFKIHQGDSCDYEFMQFTGLKDKNRKEIYEGDIVRLVSKEDGLVLADVKASVIFDTTMFCARVYIDNDDLWDYDILEYQAKYMEVIGNIYENKELLNE